MQTAASSFAHVDCWVFDLDNTLYPASCRLFDQIDQRMGAFIAERFGIDRVAARRLQKDYFVRYGTTLAGLMAEHQVPPDEFLDYVHDIDHSVIPADPAVARGLAALPGRRFVFTNGTVAHAQNVLARIDAEHLFDGIFDIAASDYVPKPDRRPYDRFVADFAVTATSAAMFEDIARNLKTPHEMGMTTVLVEHPANRDGDYINNLSGDVRAAHVHHVTDDLGAFLCALAGDTVNV